MRTREQQLDGIGDAIRAYRSMLKLLYTYHDRGYHPVYEDTYPTVKGMEEILIHILGIDHVRVIKAEVDSELHTTRMKTSYTKEGS